MPPALGEDNLDDPVVKYVRRGVVTLLTSQTVAEALSALRSQKPEEGVVYLYVVDEHGKLKGVVPTRRLLVSEPDTPVSSLMVTQIVTLPDTATVMVACEQFLLHRYLAFPVVDSEGVLLGSVDVTLFTDEMFELAERQASRDVFQLIGVHLSKVQGANAWAGFRDRFPWLLCNISGGIAAALIAGLYEQLLASAVVLALFIPVVLALAESVSIQSMSMTIQGFHGHAPKWRELLNSLSREFKTAFLLGAASGAVVGGVVWLWRGAPQAGLAVAVSICLSMITACLLGILLPTAVRALNRDPKIASGPIVLASADMVTLLFYFNLAGWMLG